MRYTLLYILLLFATLSEARKDCWPDGTTMDLWFANTQKTDPVSLGKHYKITDFGVTTDSTVVQTAAIQRVIDRVWRDGGGVIVVPKGTFLTGSLFFKPGTHLHLEDGATLKGSDRIIDYAITTTRIEGETCDYFAALVNADGVDGFTITGKGTIDGNGKSYWQEFWIRRRWNPQCTNKDAQRPRLVYISNSNDVTVQDVRLVNSPFWTNHLYRCNRVRYIDCYIYAPTENVYDVEPQRGAPSSDAIDIDYCSDILVSGCYMHVNDDAVVLKGGKGTYADKDKTNGPCRNIMITDCTFGKVHGCLTLGSESLYDRNVVLQRCNVVNAARVLWLKMRPDTPQHYEFVKVDNMKGTCGSFVVIRAWTQFYDLKRRDDMPMSQCNDITISNITMKSDNFFDVGTSDKYVLRDFTFENITVSDVKMAFDEKLISNTKTKNVNITQAK